MKKSKKFVFAIFILSTLFLAYTPVSAQSKVTKDIQLRYVDELPKKAKHTFLILEIDDNCRVNTCQQRIDEANAQYQELADELCIEVHVGLSCCLNGYVTYALLIITPNCYQ